MKKFIFITAILFTTAMFGQDRIVEKLGYFATVKVYDGLSVNLIKAKENRVEIYGKDASDVKATTSGGVLKIKMKAKQIFSGYRTFVDLYYTELDLVDANEESKVVSKETLKPLDFEVKTQEGAIVELNIKAEKITIKAVTGGKIILSGSADVQDITINTGGHFNGEELKGQQIKVTVNAGGTASVNGKRLVTATVRAGGTIDIYGNPARIDKTKFIGGKINEKY
jgi:hypothetical protein